MNAKNLYQKPDNIDDVIYKNGDTDDIISVIKMADKISAQKRYSKEFAKQFQGKPIKKVWIWIRENIRYVGDTAGYERVKLPHKTIFDGFGDCKSMTLLAIDILRELGYQCQYKFVAWKSDNPVQHVYSEIQSGNTIIYLDAVHHEFNNEVRPFYNKIIIPMTKIALVRGIKGVEDEHPLLGNRPFMNYHIMTEAEFATQIYLENLKLSEAVEGKNVRKAIEYIQNSIYKGIHGISGNLYTTGNDPEVMKARQFLEYHRNNFSGACTNAFDQSRRRGKDRSAGIDPQILGLDIEVDFESCMHQSEHTDPITGEYSSQSWIDTACQKQMHFKKAINENWEKGAHHFLYEFIPNPNIYATTVANKAIDHKAIIPETAITSGLSNANLREWAKLGVKRLNATKNLGLLSPEDSIKMLFDARYRNEMPQIGLPFLVILAIIAVASVCLGGLVQIFKGQEPTAFQYLERALGFARSASNNDFNDGKGSDNDNDNGDGDNEGDDDKNPPVDGISIKTISQPAEGGSITGGGDYDQNASFTLTATANPGYVFTGYLKNGIIASTEAFYTGKASKNESYIATFKKNDESNVNKFLSGMSTGEKVGAATIIATVGYFAFVKE